MYELRGFVRPDGRVGFRNHVLVLPTVACVSEVAMRVAMKVEGVVAVWNPYGCTQIGRDLEITTRTLIGIGRNPNVFAVLVLGLGCETVDTDKVADAIAKTGKPVEVVRVQDVGGILRAEELATSIVARFRQEASVQRRVSVDFSSLVVAVECGGSDTTSGIAANPVVGYVADRVIDLGGTVIMSEVPEMIGAEHILVKRAVSREVAEKLLQLIREWEELAKSAGADIRGSQPTPGNIAGGITTLEEKSLGAILKGGTRPIVGVLDYAEEPKSRGLWVMNTPGFDIESVTGMVAGGAQVVLFTTGRGTPVGSAIAPVIKVTANSETYRKMRDIIDFYAGTVIEGVETIKQVGEKLFKELIEVLNGKLTKSEILKHREFGIMKVSPSL
ncbi:MAG: altronate dehydratase [Thermoprotei archaeon]|nr:MAG: altronate dehydratase [Thermoprotei archaeon]